MPAHTVVTVPLARSPPRRARRVARVAMLVSTVAAPAACGRARPTTRCVISVNPENTHRGPEARCARWRRGVSPARRRWGAQRKACVCARRAVVVHPASMGISVVQHLDPLRVLTVRVANFKRTVDKMRATLVRRARLLPTARPYVVM